MTDLVVLRPQGLYCPAGDFYIDPAKPVPRAMITHAHGDHARSGSNAYWAATPGIPLLRERLGRSAVLNSVAYGARFQLGAAEVSFHSAGHILGSAQVRIACGDEVWVVSGDYKRDADPSCAPFEPVPCTTFVTEATFASPVFTWPESSAVAAEIYAWWQACKHDGQAAVLYCYALGKAQRVLAELAHYSDETAYVHNAMSALIRIYRHAGVRMLPTEAVGNVRKGSSFAGRLILAPPGASGTPWIQRFVPYCAGFASGWMQQQGGQRRLRYERGFVLSDHADWPALLQTIDETGARRVRIMHGNGDALIAHLRARGIDAASLSAPASSTGEDPSGAGADPSTETQEIETC
jgi:putative mRNA 3-end processing factor